jgi:hypothetical protein
VIEVFFEGTGFAAFFVTAIGAGVAGRVGCLVLALAALGLCVLAEDFYGSAIALAAVLATAAWIAWRAARAPRRNSALEVRE